MRSIMVLDVSDVQVKENYWREIETMVMPFG